MTTHGLSQTPEYKCWQDMIIRCTNPKSKSYKYYGARGITVCNEWRCSFEAFYRDVGPRPARGLSIERVENARGYEPGNVRWATHSEQMKNRRDWGWSRRKDAVTGRFGAVDRAGAAPVGLPLPLSDGEGGQ